MTEEEIKIYSTEDEKMNLLGKIMSNESARKILQLLFENEFTATQIGQKINISLQLVKYHINNMQDIGIVKVSKIEKNSKNQDMNYYSASRFAIVIVPSQISERTRESKSLKRSIKTIYRLVGFACASFISWIVLGSEEKTPMRGMSTESTISEWQIIIPITIITLGIIIEIVILRKRKNQSQKGHSKTIRK